MDRTEIERQFAEASRQEAQYAQCVARQQERLALAESGEYPIDVATARQLLVILVNAQTLNVVDKNQLEKKLVASQGRMAVAR